LFFNEYCEDYNKGSWWLRYCGESYEKIEGRYDCISCVNFDGYIEEMAAYVTVTNYCVRPAFWLITD